MGSNLSSTKTTTSTLPCIAIHELAQELSCPICLEIFFEPCTAPCGHNFCRKCLRLRSNCCPICRKLIGIGKSCTVNTVLWNTVQLLFPKEVEAREAIDAFSNPRNLSAQQPCEASSRGLNYFTEYDEMGSDLSSTTCIHKLTQEFSCSLCSEIFFEPSTTPCGHNFCRKCLPSFMVNSGQSCPICSQWISNGKPCTVNTVLWNTTQLLFPQKVEARKAIYALNSSRNLSAQSYYSSLDIIGKCLHNIHLGFWISVVCCAIYGQIKREKK